MTEKKPNDMISRLDWDVHNLIKLYKSKYEPKNLPKHLKKMTVLEMGILNLLERNSDLSMRDVVKILDVPNSTLTSVVDRLEKKMILYRIIDPEDKRTFKLKLTEKGEEVVKSRIMFKRELFETIFMSLDTQEEREMLVKLIEKVYSKLSKEI